MEGMLRGAVQHGVSKSSAKRCKKDIYKQPTLLKTHLIFCSTASALFCVAIAVVLFEGGDDGGGCPGLRRWKLTDIVDCLRTSVVL